MRRTRRFSGITSRADFPSSIGRFRTRRTSRFRFRRQLWSASQLKSHWRTIGSNAFTISTPTNLTSATLAVFLSAPSFWTVLGGTQQEDAGVAVPTFNGDIILRGGVTRLSVTNKYSLVAGDPVRVTIFTVWNQPTVPGFVFPSNVPITWDPSCFPDFQRNGKVLSRKDAILQTAGESVEVYYRHKVQRIDQGVYFNNGARIAFFVLISQMSDSDAGVAQVCDVVTSHSYSFAADAT